MEQSPKNRHYQQLVDGIANIIKVYRLLLDNVLNEKECLIKADIEKLTENNRSKETILLKIRTFENARLKVTRDLAATVGANTEQPRLLEIANFFAGVDGEKLRDQHGVLELLISRVNEVNKENEILAQSALKHIDGALGSLRDTFSEKPVYKKEGSLTTAPQSGRLVRCEA